MWILANLFTLDDDVVRSFLYEKSPDFEMGQKKPSEKSRVFYFIHKALGINNLALLE